MTARPLERILLVEDDPDIQVVVSMALSGIGGFTVEVSGSAAEALRTAPVFAPDLILLDVMMPGMDGLGALQALRALPAVAATPVVFVTAKIQPHEVAQYRRLGSLGVIVKPFDPATLADQVWELWRGAAAPVRAPGIPRAELEALRRRYLEGLPDNVRALREAAAALGASWDTDHLDALFHLAHRLAGSAAIHQFEAVSRAAAALEAFLVEAMEGVPPAPGPRLETLQDHVSALDRAAQAAGAVPAAPPLEPVLPESR